MSESDDALKGFMDYMAKAQEWDQFYPGNYCENVRPISRRPFCFKYHTVQIWKENKCVKEVKSNHSLVATLHGNILNVRHNEPLFADMVVPIFSFGEISESGDRIMWSKDLYNVHGRVAYNDPNLMSLFYKNGHIARIYLHIDLPPTLIEIHGTSDCPDANASMSDSLKSEVANEMVPNKYETIISYFKSHGFGTEMPVLTLLSTLPPRDRCIILEILWEKDQSNIEIYNKLSMAYLKNGQELKALSFLKLGHDIGALDAFTYQQLVEKISFLSSNMHAATQKPSQSYSDTLFHLHGRFADDAHGQYREFYNILIELCNSGAP